MPVLQRIQRITQIFESFRNPDKETVLTPWRVVKWRSVLAENIFVICKTEMARSITIRTLCGFNKTLKANTYVYNDLLEQITKNQSQFTTQLLSGKIFHQINNNMKIDVIVGNPPYQQIIGGDGLNKGLAKQLFPYFKEFP